MNSGFNEYNMIIFFYIFISWLIELFKTGEKRDLDENDLYPTLNEDKSSLLGDKLEQLVFFF